MGRLKARKKRHFQNQLQEYIQWYFTSHAIQRQGEEILKLMVRKEYTFYRAWMNAGNEPL